MTAAIVGGDAKPHPTLRLWGSPSRDAAVIADPPSSVSGDGPVPSSHPAPSVDLTTLAALVWQESGALRRAAHGRSGRRACPTGQAPYGPADPEGRRTSPFCERDGCLDIVHEVLLRSRELVRRHVEGGGSAVKEPVRYAHRVVTTQVREQERRLRVAAGGPAKPTRLDGIPGRVNVALAEGVGDVERAWRLALFRMIRAYPHRLEPHGAEWPLDGWTAEKCQYDGVLRDIGSPSSRAEIRSDIRQVLRIAEQEAGIEWVSSTILHPLLLGGCPSPAEPATSASLVEDLAVLDLVASSYVRHRRAGAGESRAFVDACRGVTGATPQPPSRETLDLLHDRLR